MTDEKGNSQESWSVVSLAWELGYIIAVPLVVLALLGRFIDKRYGTSPWFLLVGIILSIMVSSYAAYNKSKEIIDNQ